MKVRACFLPLGLMVASFTLNGCITIEEHHQPRPDTVVVEERGPYAPPPPRVEYRGTAPPYPAVWVSGHWRWDGYRYVWVPGHYKRV